MIDRIKPQINIDENGNISWVPSFVDYDASLFYRGKTVTNDEFNQLFLQRTYQANYLADSLNAILNNYLNEAISKRVAAEGVSAEELNNALADYYTVSEIDTIINLVKSDIPDINNLASVDQIPTKVSQLENDNNYISSVPDNYITEENLIVKDYATNTKVDNIARAIPTKVSDLLNDLNFLSSIPNEYITETELTNKNYATKNEIPDISNLANQKDIPTKVSELENDSGFLDSIPSEYITESELNDKNYATKEELPTSLSQLSNDEDFIKNTVDNLTNYYLKSQLYTKDEVNTIVNNIKSFNVEIVTILPTTNISTTTFYLIKKDTVAGSDYYDEYLYINNSFELIGNTKIDLSNYYTKDESDNIFAKQDDLSITNTNVNTNTENISSLINSLTQTQTSVSEISKKVDNRYTKAEVNSLISGFITKDVTNLTNYYTSSAIDAKRYVTEDVLNSKNYATSTDILNVNKDLTEARNDIAELEEAIKNMDNSAEFADRVATLEENYTLLDTAFNEVASNHDDRLYAIEGDYLTYQAGLNLPFVDYSTDQSIYSVKQFTKGLKLSTGTFVMTADGRAIVGFNSSGYVSVGNGSTQLVMNSSGRPRIYRDATHYEEVAYLSDTPEIDTSNLVDLTSTQTISGAKTFSGTIIVPDVTIT